MIITNRRERVMSNLLEVRETIKRLYGKYEMYITPVLKFLLTLVGIIMINSELGYMDLLSNVFIVLIAAVACAILPWTCSIIVCALFVIGHIYALAMECALIAVAVFAVMFLLYFRFTPKDAILVLLTPICFFLKVPYLIPICVGLVCTPVSVVSVACGVITHYLIGSVSDSAVAVSGSEGDITTTLKLMLESIIGNKAMIVTICAFAATIIVVYIIKRFAVDYSWTIAMIAGAIVDAMILLIGDLLMDTGISIVWLLLGSILAVLVAKVLEFFVFNVDYSRTERVQFEDDEYYYYVKAVPKVTVAPVAKTVKKINSSRTR